MEGGSQIVLAYYTLLYTLVKIWTDRSQKPIKRHMEWPTKITSIVLKCLFVKCRVFSSNGLAIGYQSGMKLLTNDKPALS